MSNKAFRSWLASFIFLALVVGLIFFLTFLEIPDKNKDLITSIIGMLVGSMSMAISIFVGRDPDDVASLKSTIEELNDDRNTLIARLRDAQIDKDTLRKAHDRLQDAVIDKLSVFVGMEKLRVLGKGSLPEEVNRWIPEETSLNLSDTPPPTPIRVPRGSPNPMDPPRTAELDDIFDKKR